MNILAFYWRGDGRNDSSKFRCCRYRPRPHNSSGDSPRPPFLSEFVNQVGELFFVRLIYHLFGRQVAARIHPHVQRPIGPKTESSVRLIELQTADAEVCEQTIQRARSEDFSNLRERPADVLNYRHLRAKLLRNSCELCLRLAHRFGVAIEGDQLALGSEPPRNLDRMPSEPKRCVCVDAARPHSEEFET